MKTSQFYIGFFVILCSLQAYAWKEFHGGDHVKIQWSMMAADIMADADKVPTLRKYSDMFLNTYFTIKIVTTDDDLEIDGVDKVALFEIDHGRSDKTLYIQVNRWDQMKKEEREYLVIHELLNMSGLIDDDYHYSQEIYTKLKQARPLIEQYHYLLGYVYIGFGECQLDNYRSISNLVIDRETLQSIVENVDSNPQYCDKIKKFSKKIKSIINGLSHD